MDWNILTVEASKIFLGAIAGTLFTTWYKDFKQKKEDRKMMFLRMIEAKSYISIPQTLINDLNMLPVLFRKEKNVLSKYRLYYADLCLPKEQMDYNRQQALYWDLLREMGNVVGYNNIDNHTLNSRYIPHAAVDAYMSQQEYQETALSYMKQGIELQKIQIDLHKNQIVKVLPPSENSAEKND